MQIGRPVQFLPGKQIRFSYFYFVPIQQPTSAGFLVCSVNHLETTLTISQYRQVFAYVKSPTHRFSWKRDLAVNGKSKWQRVLIFCDPIAILSADVFFFIIFLFQSVFSLFFLLRFFNSFLASLGQHLLQHNRRVSFFNALHYSSSNPRLSYALTNHAIHFLTSAWPGVEKSIFSQIQMKKNKFQWSVSLSFSYVKSVTTYTTEALTQT
jgi:hypothetical protein